MIAKIYARKNTEQAGAGDKSVPWSGAHAPLGATMPQPGYSLDADADGTYEDRGHHGRG